MELKSYSAHTNQGPSLQVNEDGYDIDLVNNLFMVMDGFGGSGIGDKSMTQLMNDIKLFYSRVVADPESTMPFFFSHKFLIEQCLVSHLLLVPHRVVLVRTRTMPQLGQNHLPDVQRSKYNHRSK